MNIKTTTLLAAAVALGLSSAAPLRAAGVPSTSTVGGSGPMKDELDEQTRNAVKRGLDWLAKNLSGSGAIERSGGDSIAIISLAGIAFLADGDMPGNGAYGKEIERILDYVLKNCQETGLVASPNYGQPMYGHGFATLFLAEAYGMSQRPDLKEKLENAIRLIVVTQNPQGGWRYQPVPNDADLSVTICQIMALRAARNAGIKVPKKTVDMALDYVKKSQEPDGGFVYVLNSRGSAYPRSAAGVACLYYLRSGTEYAEEIKKGVAYIKTNMIRSVGHPEGGGDGHYYYGNYYATQAMFMTGGDAWETYWPAIRRDLLARQQQAGGDHWTGESGDVYATSMALIMLQVPKRLLPILQK